MGTLRFQPSDVSFPDQVSLQVDLYGNIPVTIGAAITAAIYAQGAGAYCGYTLSAGILFAEWKRLSP